MRAAREDDVLELTRLCGKRIVQFGVRVAVNVHPPRRNAVEDPAAVFGEEIDAFTSDNRQWWRRRLHLRVGMPDVRAIPFDERSRNRHRKCSISRLSGSNFPAAAASVSAVNGSITGSSPITF